MGADVATLLSRAGIVRHAGIGFLLLREILAIVPLARTESIQSTIFPFAVFLFRGDLSRIRTMVRMTDCYGTSERAVWLEVRRKYQYKCVIQITYLLSGAK